MATTASLARMLVRITGLIQIVLGVLIWVGLTGSGSLVPVHMLSGTVLVLGVWALAFVGARSGAKMGLVAGAVILGLVVLILGMIQSALLVGPSHWVIQVLHLVLGLAAVGMGEALGGKVAQPKKAAMV
jgi:hypothetical protein